MLFKYLHEFERMNGLKDALPETNEEQEGQRELIRQMSILEFE